MANEKILNTRVQLKYDSYTNWTTNNPTLLAGEIAIAKLTTTHAVKPAEGDTQAPVLFKVGPGQFNDLPWVSGLAADVYSWAKKETPDWGDFPALPITIIDEDEGKYITDIEYVDNTITISRDNAVESLQATDDDIVILTVDKATGDVTVDGKHKEYNKAGSTTDVNGDAIAAGSTVTIKVPTLTVDKYGHTEFNGETSHTITIPNEVAVGDGNITIQAGTGLTDGGTFNVNQDSDTTITLSHQTKPTTGTAETATDGTGRTYVTEVLVDALGHIAGVKTATETVIDTNTAHTHKAGSGIKLDLTEPNVNGGVEGEVKLDLNIAMELSDKEIKIYDKDDTTKTAIATLDATSFIKDGMIESVELVQEDAAGTKGQFLKITWNIDDAHSTDEGAEKDVTYVNVGDLVDVYTAAPGANEVQVAISNTNVISATLVNGSITEAKLAEAVTTKLNKTWEEVGVAKGLVDALAATHATDKAALEQAIEAAKADASTKDAVVLAEAQKGIAEVQGNLTAHAENTDIHVSTAEKEAWNQKLESVTAAQDGGLVATPNAETNSVSLAIDDSITWVFYCGSSTDVI